MEKKKIKLIILFQVSNKKTEFYLFFQYLIECIF